MAGSKWKIVEWLARFENAHVLLTSEFARTLLWPAVFAVLTGATGILGGIPLMWILMSSALAFMAVTQGLLRADELRERKTPQNKLNPIGAIFSCDLTPAPLPAIGNRHQRRQQAAVPPQAPRMLPANAVVPGVPRTMDLGQLALQVKNTASFPISVILINATTEVAGLAPPRSVFPKKASVLSPGETARVPDAQINMNATPCGRLTGKFDMIIKYGLPGRENFELHAVGGVDIQMTDFGMITNTSTAWN